jgi:hypothetical protein
MNGDLPNRNEAIRRMIEIVLRGEPAPAGRGLRP